MGEDQGRGDALRVGDPSQHCSGQGSRKSRWKGDPGQSLKDHARRRPGQTSHHSEALLNLSARLSPF